MTMLVSELSTASSGDVVARSRLWSSCAMRSATPGSAVTWRRALIESTMSATGSHPTTVLPAAPRQAARVCPTLPRPKMETLLIEAVLYAPRMSRKALGTKGRGIKRDG